MNAQTLFIVCFSASLAAIGIALACAGLMLIPLAALLSRLSFTRTIPRKLIVGMLGTALSMALLAVAAHLPGAAWLLLSFVLLGVGEVLVAPLLQLSLCPSGSVVLSTGGRSMTER